MDSKYDWAFEMYDWDSSAVMDTCLVGSTFSLNGLKAVKVYQAYTKSDHFPVGLYYREDITADIVPFRAIMNDTYTYDFFEGIPTDEPTFFRYTLIYRKNGVDTDIMDNNMQWIGVSIVSQWPNSDWTGATKEVVGLAINQGLWEKTFPVGSPVNIYGLEFWVLHTICEEDPNVLDPYAGGPAIRWWYEKLSHDDIEFTNLDELDINSRGMKWLDFRIKGYEDNPYMTGTIYPSYIIPYE